MKNAASFHRRGIVEGFFGPPWTMAHRQRIFALGAARGMNCYLYAPKDDPYHREKWRVPYPRKPWQQLRQLIKAAQRQNIDFVYGFHPGKGLCFGDLQPVKLLLAKAQRFYDEGVRTFAVLFDDIPSRLDHSSDRKLYGNSLARAEATWLCSLLEHQPATWRSVEWWICPSYYSPDPLLAQVFGRFENHFLETLAAHLPGDVAVLWTGQAIVPKTVKLAHIRQAKKFLQRRVILWDNYPVNDLSMSSELHIAPLTGRDESLPRAVYGYLNNPLLQEHLSILPLITCFDYARAPARYRPETSWRKAVAKIYGARSLTHWQTIRQWCQEPNASRPEQNYERRAIEAALAYIHGNRTKKWAKEMRPWIRHLESLVTESAS